MTSFEPVRSGDPEQDRSRLRRLYGRYPTGVAAVCAMRDGQPAAIIATSFIPVSLDPPLVSICVQHTSTTWPSLSQANCLGVSVLASSHEAACVQMAAKNVDRFAGISWFAGESDEVYLADAAAWLGCRVSMAVPAGDHDVVVLTVDNSAVNDTVPPLVFHDSHFRTLAG